MFQLVVELVFVRLKSTILLLHNIIFCTVFHDITVMMLNLSEGKMHRFCCVDYEEMKILLWWLNESLCDVNNNKSSGTQMKMTWNRWISKFTNKKSQNTHTSNTKKNKKNEREITNNVKSHEIKSNIKCYNSVFYKFT